MIRRVNDIKLEEYLCEVDGWIVCAWITPQSIPCDHFKPEFEGVEARMSSRILFVDIDAAEHEEYTAHMKIQAVPTTVVYFEGEEKKRFEGPYSKERIIQDLNLLMKGKRRRKK